MLARMQPADNSVDDAAVPVGGHEFAYNLRLYTHQGPIHAHFTLR